MANLTEPIVSETNASLDVPKEPAIIWQEWAKKRAQYAPTLEQVKEITKKVKINVTRNILEERQET
ncbi:MAG: hypothetical protein ACI8V2_004829 [Candidatus Latescibacterota bacterium]|jgi:hypothetical protein